MTATYVDVRLERKQIVLDAYHNALHPKKEDAVNKPKQENSEAKKKPPKKGRDIER